MKDLSFNYEILKLLGSGSFGDVYLCINRATKEKYAIKLQKAGIKHTLKREIDVYRYLNSNLTSPNDKKTENHFLMEFETYCMKYNVNEEKVILNFFSSKTKNYIARIYDSGYYEVEGQKRYGFVMDLFEKSVSDFIKSHKLPYTILKDAERAEKCNDLCDEGKESVKIGHILMLGCLMLNAIESIHKKLIIHADIKPGNFVFKNDNLILIDYGLAKRIEFCKPGESDSHDLESQEYSNSSKAEEKKTNKTKKRGFRGTMKYASMYAHKGKPLSFKDDVESMIYLLCSLTEQLPWSKKDRKVVPSIKNEFVPKHPLLKKLLKYVRSLKVNEIVDYTMIRGIFLNEMRKIEWEFDMSVFT